MISLEKYKRVLDNGLLLDHYMILCNIRDGTEMPKSKRVDGFINLLNKKGYIDDGALTTKAFDIIDVQPVMVVDRELVETPKFDYGGWGIQMHAKCKKKIMELTGREQVTSKIKGDKKGFPFLLNVNDFVARIFSTVQKYKLKDMDAVEKALINHIDSCHKANNWFPLMKYYISKQGEGSQMVTDLESGVEVVKTEKSAQKFV